MNAEPATTVRLEEALRAPVAGRRLTGSTLGDEIGAGRTLLVFLRHFG